MAIVKLTVKSKPKSGKKNNAIQANKRKRAAAVEDAGEFLSAHFSRPRREIEFCAIEIKRDDNGKPDATKSRAAYRAYTSTSASPEVLSRVAANCVGDLERFEFFVSLYSSGRHRVPDAPWKMLLVYVTDPITGDVSEPLPIAAPIDATPALVRDGYRDQLKSWWNQSFQLRMIHQAMIAEVEARGWNWSDFDRRRGRVQREKSASDVRWREICRLGHPLWMLDVLTEPERARFAETSKETILKYLGSGVYRSKHFDRTRTKPRSSVTVTDKRSAIRKPSQSKKRKS